MFSATVWFGRICALAALFSVFAVQSLAQRVGTSESVQIRRQLKKDGHISSDFAAPIFPRDLGSMGWDSLREKDGKKITRNLWIAVVNASEVAQWEHIKEEQRLNPDWTVHLCDNHMKDQFMSDNFAGTSLLWAYNNINQKVGGAAKADIWRYAVLFLKGGVYIDADAALTKPLEPIIGTDDEMVITYELNHYDGDWCYSPNSKLSTILTNRHHPTSVNMDLFRGRNILNWCIMSAPGHLFLKRALENFVHLMRLEYIGLSALKMAKFDKFSKHVYCTTGPSLLTASCREALIEIQEHQNAHNEREEQLYRMQRFSSTSLGKEHSVGTSVPIPSTTNKASKSTIAAALLPVAYGINSTTSVVNYNGPKNHRLASRDFLKEGGRFKVINTVKSDGDHYTKVEKHHHRFLIHYAPENVTVAAIQEFARSEEMNGKLVMGRYKKSVYYLDNGVRRQFNGMDVLMAWNFSLSQVTHLSDFVVNHIPLGEEMGMPPKR